jgi:SAM-dependent methyltransferase
MKIINRYINTILLYINQFFPLKRFFLAFPRFCNFFKSWQKYNRLSKKKIKFIDSLPSIHDNEKKQGFDSHYLYQGVWARKRIIDFAPKEHVDIGSKLEYVASLTSITKTKFVDIRSVDFSLANFEFVKGDILALPFKSDSVQSISCLHVAEHIGLGRYGDKLDPQGTKKACKELTRVLKPKGRLFFSLPIGRRRTCFNSHRIHFAEQILGYFNSLKLLELSGVTDNNKFKENIDKEVLNNCLYGCGFFIFTK